MTVAELLTASKAAHMTARQYAGRGRGSDPLQYRTQIGLAFQARDGAETLDPEFTESAWAADVKPTHQELMTFYRTVLAR